jgi:phosphopantothenoylcysteine decarboxylase/phosphopantothenate--cysteine ligase
MFDTPDKKHVVLGITGSIAAYKACELARQLVSWGYEVRCIMTESAQEFVSPLTFEAITGNRVATDFWESESPEIGHIEIADWADAVVIAPATADFIAKLKNGFSDTPLLAVCLATRSKIMVAPAMNVNMFLHPVTQEHVKQLKERGITFVDPEEGALACGWNGSGRLANPVEIFHNVRRMVSRGDYTGKKVVVVTGPTREAFDPVRFISNRSSGKMGVCVAREAFRRGAAVTMIHGIINAKVPNPVKCIPVNTALEMRDAVMSHAFPIDSAPPDVVVMAAAVSDFRPKNYSQQKIKKGKHPSSIELVQNPDILHELGSKRDGATSPTLVGFAVETGEIDDLIDQARNKLEAKQCDLIVGNFAQDAFELDTNRVWLVDRQGRQEEIATSYKSRVANKILDRVLKV